MSEKRKPRITMLLRFEANGALKKAKIQLYDASDFENSKWGDRKKFRMRLNGKWWPEGSKKAYYYKTEIRDILWRSIPFY